MDDIELSRSLGRLEGNVQQIHVKLSDHDRRMDSMAKEVHEMNNTIQQARGGWKLMFAVGSAGGILGAIATKTLGLFK